MIRFALPLILIGSLASAAPDPTPATGTPAPGYSLANCVHPFDAAKAEKTDVGYQFWFADRALADGQTVKLSVVGPNLATHAAHHHAEDEFFFILEGAAEFTLDGGHQVVGPQTLLYCPSWHEHGIRSSAQHI